MPTTLTETAVCTACHTEKPLEAFSLDKTKANGHRTQCAECRRIKARNARRELKQLHTQVDESPEAVRRREAHRKAVLRLIEKNRSQFEYFVFDELEKLEAHDQSNTPRWVSLSKLLEYERAQAKDDNGSR